MRVWNIDLSEMDKALRRQVSVGERAEGEEEKVVFQP